MKVEYILPVVCEKELDVPEEWEDWTYEKRKKWLREEVFENGLETDLFDERVHHDSEHVRQLIDYIAERGD